MRVLLWNLETLKGSSGEIVAGVPNVVLNPSAVRLFLERGSGPRLGAEEVSRLFPDVIGALGDGQTPAMVYWGDDVRRVGAALARRGLNASTHRKGIACTVSLELLKEPLLATVGLAGGRFVAWIGV